MFTIEPTAHLFVSSSLKKARREVQILPGVRRGGGGANRIEHAPRIAHEGLEPVCIGIHLHIRARAREGGDGVPESDEDFCRSKERNLLVCEQASGKRRHVTISSTVKAMIRKRSSLPKATSLLLATAVELPLLCATPI